MVTETARAGYHEAAVRGDGRDGARVYLGDGFHSRHAESIEHRSGGLAAGQHQICGFIDNFGGDLGQGVHQAMCVRGGDRALDREGHRILHCGRGGASRE